ncbi:MAG TPA: glycosyltransferase family 39 protein [Pyrinomonadaceae bacterium]|nr:glycosyltransferase family 39 protein [Pyrinomonadaceae bacterium]
MNGLLATLSFLCFITMPFLIPVHGGTAILLCAVCALVACYLIKQSDLDKEFLLRVFVSALLVRIVLATAIYYLRLQNFFGGDALTYDQQAYLLTLVWQGQITFQEFSRGNQNDFLGMPYLVAGIYTLVGRNSLAVQFFNAVLGAATAPVVYICAQRIFQNVRVARVASLLVAFYPSLILWSSQALKDAPIMLLLTVTTLTTLKLGERFSVKYLVVLLFSLFGLLSLRFYIFYIMVVAVGAGFIIGMRQLTAQSFVKQLMMVVCVGLALTYLGVLRTASQQIEDYGSLERVQRSRQDLAASAQSGFAQDVDVSTTSGALSVIPLGMIYLLFAPFPWQMANLRQSITLPEMMLWWGSFPLLVLGGWFTLKYRLRQALPILLFTMMLTLAYSIFQGNVGTAYRQRSQLLIFYFIFVAVGYVLLRERKEERVRQAIAAREEVMKNRRRRPPTPEGIATPGAAGVAKNTATSMAERG